MNTGIIIQARMGSSRFPGKVLRTLDDTNKSLLGMIVSRLQIGLSELPVIVATSTNGIDDEIEKWCVTQRVPVSRGSEKNVLERFVQTAKKFGFEQVVRVCSDNPFINPKLILNLLKLQDGSYDYISYRVSGIPAIKTHYGIFAEVARLTALETEFQSGLMRSREHVTTGLYEQADYKRKWIDIDLPEDIRLTIDTEDDFGLIRKILRNEQLLPDGKSLQEWMNNLAQDKDVMKTMKNQIRRQGK